MSKFHNGATSELIEALTLDPDSGKRVVGRLLATGVSETISAWLAVEQERGTPSVDLLIAFQNMSAQIVGSVIFYVANSDANATKVAKHMAAGYRRTLQQHVAVLLANLSRPASRDGGGG